MAIIVEDGTGVAGANSYATVAQAREFAESRGRDFPEDTEEGNAAATVLLLNACDAIERLRGSFQGEKTTRDQALSFPRVGVEIEGYEYDSNEIPPNVVKAQIWLAIESQTQPLVLNVTGPRLLRMKVEGAVELQYADDGASDGQPYFPLVDAELAPLLGDGEEPTFGGFRTERV